MSPRHPFLHDLQLYELVDESHKMLCSSLLCSRRVVFCQGYSPRPAKSKHLIIFDQSIYAFFAPLCPADFHPLPAPHNVRRTSLYFTVGCQCLNCDQSSSSSSERCRKIVDLLFCKMMWLTSATFVKPPYDGQSASTLSCGQLTLIFMVLYICVFYARLTLISMEAAKSRHRRNRRHPFLLQDESQKVGMGHGR